MAVVPSHDGVGTNVLAWRDPASFAPSFGPASASRHLAVPGAVRVDEPGLALDVDTAGDLRLVAGRLDPASVTAHRLRDLDMLPHLTGSTEEVMLQGTVKSFDPETQAAVVLTDARVEYDVPAEVFRSRGCASSPSASG